MGKGTCVQKLFILKLGDLETSCEEMLPGRADGTRYLFPITAALLDLGSRGWMLFDTGMDDDHVGNPGLVWGATDLAADIVPRLPADQTLLTRLAEIGIGVDDITHVVNSHLHFDHAGNNHRFSEATVHVQAEQLRDTATRPASYPIQVAATSNQVRAHDGQAEVVPGVLAFPTPGHVPGHQSLHVKLENGPDLILCGDAIPNKDFLDDENFGSFRDPPRSLGTAQRLLAVARSQRAELVFSHDRAQLEAMTAERKYFS